MKISRYIILIFGILSVIYSQSVMYFDGERAMTYLQKQCEFGPRNPGSIGHANTAMYFEKFFASTADESELMLDTIPHPYQDEILVIKNFYARFNPELDTRLLLMAHWDTRAVADKDPVEENQNRPILGANDGASGVAVLMVLAEYFQMNPLANLGVDILLVDAEDIGRAGDIQNFGIGTRVVSKRIPKPYPRGAICLDMIGDAELNLKIEQFSYIQAPDLVMEIWNMASMLGYSQFERSLGLPIMDDHRVLYETTGIPSIDIIDFNYPNADSNYWHTLEDTPDKCSAESLAAVGTVVLNYIYRLDGALK